MRKDLTTNICSVQLIGMQAQRSFDDLGTPLHEVTFCVIDFETTGGDAASCLITEVGAVKVRGGEIVGSFQTLVNPGAAIPPRITVITGITDRLVARAPSIDQVLPSLLEFIGGAVIVGHNVRFDLAFLHAAIRRWGGPLLGNQHLDTLALSRRLLADEVPRFALGELAKRLRLPHQPNHRALEDAWATVDLLHYLIERASAWGVTGLDDLVALPGIAGHPQARKLGLTNGLPRKPGVYRFLAADGQVLYVGKATDLRSRVRSYFSSDQRRKVSQLLRETHQITWDVHPSSLAAELAELRLIQEHQPRFNRRSRRPTKPSFVHLDPNERLARLRISRAKADRGISLGPLTTRRQAELVIEAVHTAIPLRRCTQRVGVRTVLPVVGAPCTAGQLKACACPCSGATSEADYVQTVALAARALSGEPSLVLDRLAERMVVLAAAERFEEAAAVRDRAGAFVAAISRQRKLDAIERVGRLEVETSTGQRIVLDSGDGSPPRTLDEALCITRWLDRHADRLRVVEADGPFCTPLPGLPDFEPRPEPGGSKVRRSG